MNTPITITTAKTTTDEFLRDILKQRISAAHMVGKPYEVLWQRIDQVMMSGGKRIRPFLTMVGYGALDDAIVPVAAAWECMHVAMLMHDDVIDQDFVRHGEKNINGLYRDDYGSYLTEPRVTHYANSAAILAGDLLLSEAFRLMHSANFDHDILTRVTDELWTAVYEVVGGELIDVEAPFVGGDAIDPLNIYRYKTASYSFIGPLLSGAYCSRASGAVVDGLRAFATNVGIAFQIQDDLHNIYAATEEIGKSVLSDLREGKRTLLAAYHQKHMNAEQAERFTAFGDATASEDRLLLIRSDMEQTGAKAEAERLVEQYFGLAESQLAFLDGDDRAMLLRELLDGLRGRTH